MSAPTRQDSTYLGHYADAVSASQFENICASHGTIAGPLLRFVSQISVHDTSFIYCPSNSLFVYSTLAWDGLSPADLVHVVQLYTNREQYVLVNE